MQQLDFNKIGKRMPYTVPEGFFDQLGENVMVRAKAEERKRHKRGRLIAITSTIMTMAAAAALFFVVTTTTQPADEVEFTDVEQAFNNLSDDDQAYLLAVYQEDVFLDNQQNQ